MKAQIGSALIALSLVAFPMAADLGGVTVSPINSPATAVTV